jgi:hypothetical protein
MNSDSDNRWVWFLMRRIIVHLWLGSTAGMIWGASCMCFAGIILAVVIGSLNGVFIHPYSIPMIMFGIGYGAIIGGVIGFIAGGTIGILAPPSREAIPEGTVIGSSAAGMAIGTVLGVCLYFICSFLFGMANDGFAEATAQLMWGAYTVIPVFLGIGQIYGIMRGYSNLGKEDTSPDYIEPDYIEPES